MYVDPPSVSGSSSFSPVTIQPRGKQVSQSSKSKQEDFLLKSATDALNSFKSLTEVRGQISGEAQQKEEVFASYIAKSLKLIKDERLRYSAEYRIHGILHELIMEDTRINEVNARATSIASGFSVN